MSCTTLIRADNHLYPYIFWAFFFLFFFIDLIFVIEITKWWSLLNDITLMRSVLLVMLSFGSWWLLVFFLCFDWICPMKKNAQKIGSAVWQLNVDSDWTGECILFWFLCSRSIFLNESVFSERFWSCSVRVVLTVLSFSFSVRFSMVDFKRVSEGFWLFDFYVYLFDATSAIAFGFDRRCYIGHKQMFVFRFSDRNLWILWSLGPIWRLHFIMNVNVYSCFWGVIDDDYC